MTTTNSSGRMLALLCTAVLVMVVGMCPTGAQGQILIESISPPPLVALRNYKFDVTANFTWKAGRLYDNSSTIYYRVLRLSHDQKLTQLYNGSVSPILPDTDDLRTSYTFAIKDHKVRLMID